MPVRYLLPLDAAAKTTPCALRRVLQVVPEVEPGGRGKAVPYGTPFDCALALRAGDSCDK